jgi:hypothetical protein
MGLVAGERDVAVRRKPGFDMQARSGFHAGHAVTRPP